jgi:uncharacterized protein YjdB
MVMVTAEAVAVTGVSLNKSALTLGIGGTEKLTATITPEDATNQNVTWASSAPAIATVATDGTVTAVAEGTATITATTEDGNKTATCAVTVTLTPTGAEEPEVLLARIYPNPTDGVVTLEFETVAARNITISDMAGKTLLRQTANDQTVRIDIGNYPSGVYLITIEEGKEKSTTRVVKN